MRAPLFVPVAAFVLAMSPFPASAQAKDLLAAAETMDLAGKRAAFKGQLKEVSVVMLWTSMCSDPVGQLRQFDAVARAFAKNGRVSVFAVNVDQAKSLSDIEVIKEVAAPAKVTFPVVSDTAYSVLSFVDGRDYGGKVPNELRVPQVLILRGGEIRHRGGLSEMAVTHYRPLIEQELKALKKATPAAKR